jgi:hypothetical protein
MTMTKQEQQMAEDAQAVCDWILDHINGVVESLPGVKEGRIVKAGSVLAGMSGALIVSSKRHGHDDPSILSAFKNNLAHIIIIGEEGDEHQCDTSGKLYS